MKPAERKNNKENRPTKICIVTTSKADYGRIRPLIKEIQSREKEANLKLQVVLGTSIYADHLLWYLFRGDPKSAFRSLPWYLKARLHILFGGSNALGKVERLAYLLKQDGISIRARIPMHIEDDSHKAMARTSGFAFLGATRVFEKLTPDVVVLYGDRAELLTIAAAATMLHIPIVHVEGGDVSGTIDEHIRHALTKLSHLHFPITEKSAERIIKMGELPQNVLPSGMLALDTVASSNLSITNDFYERVSRGAGRIDFTKPYLLVMYHPVTTRVLSSENEARCITAALEVIGMPVFILAPNSDAGGKSIHTVFRDYARTHPNDAAFYKSVPVEDFYRIMKNAAVCVGNSSSFIRESAFLGVPTVLVGDRQHNRERGENVLNTPCEASVIAGAIKKQLSHGPFPKDLRFGEGQSAKKIVDKILATDFQNFDFQKSFFEES